MRQPTLIDPHLRLSSLTSISAYGQHFARIVVCHNIKLLARATHSTWPPNRRNKSQLQCALGRGRNRPRISPNNHRNKNCLHQEWVSRTTTGERTMGLQSPMAPRGNFFISGVSLRPTTASAFSKGERRLPTLSSQIHPYLNGPFQTIWV